MELMEIVKKVWLFELVHFAQYEIRVYHFFAILLLFFLTKFLIRIVNRIIQREIKKKELDPGRTLAIFQIFKYVVIVLAIIIGLETLGIHLNIILAGSAALLVGVGLGLQNTFNDFVSGVILLFEGSVMVGDIVEVGGIIGKVKIVNIRTSEITTRDNISIIVPNSKLINDNVINWSHNREATRFVIEIGVAYGSDVPLVKKILEESAAERPEVAKTPPPYARFDDFGDSALIFGLLFWSNNMWRVEKLKSEIRFAIDQKFRNSKVVIPFPQRDLHVKSGKSELSD